MEKKSITSNIFYCLLGVFIIWAISFIVSSCGVTRKIEQVKSPADTPGAVYGIGIGESFDYNTAKMFAENSARGEVSRKIYARVKSFTNTYSSQHNTANGKRKGKEHYENISETYVSTSADNAFSTTVVDHKVERSGGKYIYYVCLGARTGVVAEEVISGKGEFDNATRATIISHRDEFLNHMTK